MAAAQLAGQADADDAAADDEEIGCGQADGDTPNRLTA
jgi:hypothetical protein